MVFMVLLCLCCPFCKEKKDVFSSIAECVNSINQQKLFTMMTDDQKD